MSSRLLLALGAAAVLAFAAAAGPEKPPDRPADHQSANGREIPTGTAVAAFQVRRSASLSALVGQLGIVDIVNGIRSGGAGQVAVVYYNPKQATTNAILQQLRTKSPSASQVDSKSEKL